MLEDGPSTSWTRCYNLQRLKMQESLLKAKQLLIDPVLLVKCTGLVCDPSSLIWVLDHEHRRNPRLIRRRSSLHHPWGNHVNISSAEWLLLKTIWLVTHWESMSIFVQSERSFQRTLVSLFKMATMNDLMSCCDSEVVVMLPFLQNSFVFNTIDLIGQ